LHIFSNIIAIILGSYMAWR